MTNYRSWGNYPIVEPKAVYPFYWRGDDEFFHSFQQTDENFLCYGYGRSYGDCCLNEDGILLDCSKLNRFISFDKGCGLLRCEAGVTFSEILKVIVPYGWFLPVVPGTQFVSVGGAIANDIHGKNHHQAGTFGRYVKCFELIRSDGNRFVCSSNNNAELFAATIGGLGLTGLITWAEIQLIPIKSPYLNVQYIQFGCLEEFYHLSKISERGFTYTVAWIDCLASKKSFGRGIFMRANHTDEKKNLIFSRRALSIPFYFPRFVLNHCTIKAFNSFYFHKQLTCHKNELVHYQSFFFQLDAIQHWNKIYGKRGFFQYQCVVSEENKSVIFSLLHRIAKSGQGSFLSVLKTFGEISSPGFLSFPKKGITLAFDFQNHGKKTLQLLQALDELVIEGNGRVYPAKDARMSKEAFQTYFPQLPHFMKYKDFKFSSSFWRRMQ